MASRQPRRPGRPRINAPLPESKAKDNTIAQTSPGSSAHESPIVIEDIYDVSEPPSGKQSLGSNIFKRMDK